MKKMMQKLQENRKNNKGFTLVELIIVIAIIAVLAAVLAPQYIRYVERSREATDANAVAEIAHAAEIAMVGNGTIVPGTNTTVATIGADGTYSYTASNELSTAIANIVPTANYTFKSTLYKGKAITVIVSTDGVANWYAGSTANTNAPSKAKPTN